MVKEKVLHTDDKAIIVSQWPSMLHLIDQQLSQYHVKTELFSGAVPVLLRNKIVDEFNDLKRGPKVNKTTYIIVFNDKSLCIFCGHGINAILLIYINSLTS